MKYLNILLGIIGAGIGILGYLLIGYALAGWGRPIDPWVFVLAGFLGLLATAFFVAGVKGIRYGLGWVPPPDVEGQPWLKVENWRKREIVYGSVVHGFYLVLAYICFGVPAVMFAWAVIDSLRGSRGDSLELLSLAVVIVFCLAGLTYRWLRHRRYGNSVCRLLTFPGVIGGWFKADVECALPPDPAEPVIVRLKNLIPEGRSVREVWRMEQKLTVAVSADKRSVVPVRLRIPRDPAQRVSSLKSGIKEALFGTVGYWVLEIEKETAGVDFFAKFRVPIYDTPDAPPSEQRAEA